MERVLINCDLGENESPEQSAKLLGWVDAANIGCGVHAGSLNKTVETLIVAKRRGVLVGAHPGLAAEGGRGRQTPTPSAFTQLLGDQLGSFFTAAAAVGVPVNHVKLHGSLYHAVEREPKLAEIYLSYLENLEGAVGVFALAGHNLAQAARARGIPVWEELFADRSYTVNGELVSRDQRDAVLTDPDQVADRFEIWLESGQMTASNGERFPVSASTVCVHGDSPNSLAMIQRLKALLAS